MNTSNLSNEYQEIEAALHDFYLHMELGNVEEVFDMLSPNLQQLTAMEQHKENYQSAFKFGRKICGTTLHSLTEIKPNLLEGIVLLCLLREDAKPISKGNIYRQTDLVYSAFKIQFIFLDKFWFIDDIITYKEFWSKEFKKILAQELASLN